MEVLQGFVIDSFPSANLSTNPVQYKVLYIQYRLRFYKFAVANVILKRPN